MIARFWRRMVELYETKWTSKQGTTPKEGTAWIDLLCVLTEQQIAKGIALLVENDKEWPPTPIEFKNICTDVNLKALGLPDAGKAFSQALNGRVSSNVVRAAMRETGSYDLKNLSYNDLRYSQIKRLFEDNYFEMARRWANGESLDKPTEKSLEHIQEQVSYRFTDDLINQEVERLKASGLGGYSGFKGLVKRSS